MPGNKQCSASGCVNGPRNNYKERGISLHCFPLKHPEQLEAWLKRIGREGFVPSVYSLLCSEHFVESDFCYQLFTGRRQLKPGVVPSIFSDLPKKSKRKTFPKSGNAEEVPTSSSSDLGKEMTETVIIPYKGGSRRKRQLDDFSKESLEAPDKDLSLECSEDHDFSLQNFTASNMCKSVALCCSSETCLKEMRRLDHDLCQTILELKWLQEKVQELQALAETMDLDVLNVLVNGHEEGKDVLDKVCHLVGFLMDRVEIKKEFFEEMPVNENSAVASDTDVPEIHLTPDSFTLPTIKSEPIQYHEATPLMDSPEEQSLNPSLVSHLAHQQEDYVGIETGGNYQRENSQCLKICYTKGETAHQPPATVATKQSLSESTNKIPPSLHHVLSKQLSSSSRLKEMMTHADPHPDSINKSIFLVGPLSVNESGVCTLDSQVKVIPMRAWDPNTNTTDTTTRKRKGNHPNEHKTNPSNSECAFSTEGVTITTRVNGRQRKCMDQIGGAQSPNKCHFDKLKTKTTVPKKMCDLCGRFFMNGYILKLHIKTVHKKEKPFECRQCTLRFSTKGPRNFHMKTHSDNRPHQCSLCSKTFKMKYTLNKHQLTHSSERPFHCVLCNTRFKRKSSLTLHRKQFHE